MKNTELIYRCSTVKVAAACAAIGWMCLSAGSFSHAQTPATTAPATNASALSPDLQEVITLSKEQMGDEVITNYVLSTGKVYQLTADQIIYLKNQGVSSPVLNVLIQTASSANNAAAANAPVITENPPPAMPSSPPTVAQPSTLAPVPYSATAAPNIVTPPLVPTTPAPPPEPGPETASAPDAAPDASQPQVNLTYFQTQLAPFGTWVQVPGYGLCWQPTQAIAANPDWRPYYDMGQWMQTDNGLFWASDYTWGDIPFHYGRWILQPGYGWLWSPGYTWGPAWVCWRQADADGCIGWAPLPVGAVFVGGVWMFNGVRVDIGTFGFGLGANFFVFVGSDHFHEPFFRMRGHEWAYHIPPGRSHEFYGRSIVHNDFHRDEHGRLVNDGIGRERMAQLTHNRIEQAHFEERNPVGDRNKLEKTAGHQPEEARNTGVQRTVDERSEQHTPAAADNKVFRPSQSQKQGGGSAQRQSSRENGERGNH
jgi:hypothetical protein